MRRTDTTMAAAAAGDAAGAACFAPSAAAPDGDGRSAGHAPSLPLASARVMIIDDEPTNVKVVRKYLALQGYQQFIAVTEPTEAVAAIRGQQPHVILLDIMMPRVSGLEILEAVRDAQGLIEIPVIILTAADDKATKARALDLGATDFLSKPVDPIELVPRVRSALTIKAHYDHLRNSAQELQRLVRQRTAELDASRLELIHCLARAAEYRDNETGRHVIRVGRYAGVIARQLQLDPVTVELIEHAAPLHDIGKVGVPDHILLKPGKLTGEEYELMQQHTQYGERTFQPMSDEEDRAFRLHTFMGEQIMDVAASPIISMAARIALTHHEKWDGSGYPRGLAGEAIPIGGRITAVADVFDALASRRPYKEALPLEKCFRIMEEGRGRHFDPRVLDAFFQAKDQVVAISRQCADGDEQVAM